MTPLNLFESQIENSNQERTPLKLSDKELIEMYSDSINKHDHALFFIGRKNLNKFLYIISEDGAFKGYEKFEGEINKADEIGSLFYKKCELNHPNASALQELFSFTKPIVIGLQNSFGFGDRIGLANAGHIRSLENSNFKPVLAQQSIRELSRTNRTANEVMNAAVWAVFQEGFKDGFGADADHLKTTEDIDYMVDAGYKMLTFDPSEFVDNNADIYDEENLSKAINELSWNKLIDSYDESKKRYLTEIKINSELKIQTNEIALKRAYAKYGNALIHIKFLYDHIKYNYSENDFEIEVSVDETESVTSIFEHYFISSELTRMGIKFISLAPRFIGDFEKGIDYKGDLGLFKEEYKKHLAVTRHFGNYKISLHSGSDKFGVYKVIGSLKDAYTHVKTAGTSYLEALKVTALKEPDLFRGILDFSGGLYEKEKKTYHVSADINKVKKGDQYRDEELLELFNSNDARQILHVTFGRVLTEKDAAGNHIFKDKIKRCLIENEDLHYQIIIEHFKKHLEPFK
jgi:tagaturonate epimerase